MLKSKGASDFSEQQKIVEGWISNQEYIAESSIWFTSNLIEEREILREEGGKIRDKSHKLISVINEQGIMTSDFISWTIMFAKFYEIVGQLVAQNHSIFQKETKCSEIDSLAQELRNFMVNMNRQSIVDKLREMEKLKNQYQKSKTAYEKAIKKTEEAIK